MTASKKINVLLLDFSRKDFQASPADVKMQRPLVCSSRIHALQRFVMCMLTFSRLLCPSGDGSGKGMVEQEGGKERPHSLFLFLPYLLLFALQQVSLSPSSSAFFCCSHSNPSPTFYTPSHIWTFSFSSFLPFLPPTCMCMLIPPSWTEMILLQLLLFL